jgi:ABC-type antimicrobial peptide transport system permease subunit
VALGATRAEVLWMIVRESLYLVVAGLILGLPLAWFTSKLMASMLFRLSPRDSFSFVAAGLGMLLVSLAAAFLPARRAASIEPMQALRSD